MFFRWCVVFKNNKDSLIRTTLYLLTIEKSPDLLSISPNMSCELCLHAFACDTYVSMTRDVFSIQLSLCSCAKNKIFHFWWNSGRLKFVAKRSFNLGHCRNTYGGVYPCEQTFLWKFASQFGLIVTVITNMVDVYPILTRHLSWAYLKYF